jgi:type I restriction enzyme S subunit
MAPDGWRVCTVDQIKAQVERAIAIGPFGSRMKSDLYVPTGVPVIRGNNISETRALAGDFVYVTSETADELASSNVFPGDLFFPHRGAIGLVGIVPPDGPKRYVLSTSLMKLSCNSELVDPLFVFYYFRSVVGQHELLKHASTVGTPGIGQPLASLRSMSIQLPPRSEQRAIAHILGTLDDKIELNRRMNETLEAMARVLFKSWFMDFDPVRAKAEGRDPGLPKSLAGLFPDSFGDSELGEIPGGWRIGQLEDVASVTMGISPNGESYNANGIGLPLINGPVEFGDYFPVKSKWTTSPAKRAEAGDLIFCVRGSTTGRRVVADDTYCLGRGVCAIRPRIVSRTFLYQIINTGLDRLLSKTTGSVFPSLSGPDIRRFSVLVPDRQIARAFERIAEPLTERAEANVRASRTLAALRDTLLPQLISGELRVKDAEKLVGSAA